MDAPYEIDLDAVDDKGRKIWQDDEAMYEYLHGPLDWRRVKNRIFMSLCIASYYHHFELWPWYDAAFNASYELEEQIKNDTTSTRKICTAETVAA